MYLVSRRITPIPLGNTSFTRCIHRTPISRVVFMPSGELRRLLLHIARLDGSLS